jgi:hypothetical protein
LSSSIGGSNPGKYDFNGIVILPHGSDTTRFSDDKAVTVNENKAKEELKDFELSLVFRERRRSFARFRFASFRCVWNSWDGIFHRFNIKMSERMVTDIVEMYPDTPYMQMKVV